MTVSSTANRVVYSGNAATTNFPFAFKVQSPADLVVIYTDATGTDFTLSPAQYGAAGFGLDAGGTVTYPVSGAPIAVGTKLTIYRNVSATQPAVISNQGAMWPSVIESALDRATYILQRVADSVSRALVISPTDGGTLNPLPNATQRANSVLGFDGTGQPYAAQLVAGLGSASTWLVANFFPMASAAAARGALGTSGLADNNAFTGEDSFSQSPTVPTPAIGDSSQKAASTAFVARTGYLNTQTFPANGTYTPTAGMKYCVIELVGGGGGGGGVASAGANLQIGGGGGGAGSYSKKIAPAVDIGISKVVTIGAAGTAGASGNNAGGAGGDTSFGTLCIGKGGSGGGGSSGAAGALAVGGSGGVAGAGLIAVPGEAGESIPLTGGTSGSVGSAKSGQGASSPFGAGGKSATAVSAASAAGNAGSGFGSGGSGGVSSSGGAAAAGGAGTTGYAIVTEYA